MKTLIPLVCVYLICTAAASATTITFDDVNTGGLQAYDGLQWSGFNVVIGSARTNTGYVHGTVSPSKVATDIDGRAAQFSSGTTFNLNSAYLTGAYSDGLKMEVQGFNGTTLLYDNTYIVNTTEAKLVNFNYTGITEAKFIPSGGTLHTGYVSHGIDNTDFAMDNVTISAPDGGVTAGLLGMTFAGLVLLRKRLAC